MTSTPRIVRSSDVPSSSAGDLSVADYTAGLEGNASLAVITLPPGGRHPLAYSTKCDKYYWVAEGRVRFLVEGKRHDLVRGDACIVPRGQRFAYENVADFLAKLLLFHTPPFDADAEVVLG